jgi:hypothetical protein
MGSWFEPFRECLWAKVGETGVPLANASRDAAKADEFEADTAVAMGWLFGSMSHRINTGTRPERLC